MKLTYISAYLIGESRLLSAIHKLDVARYFGVLPIRPKPFGAVAD